MNAKISTSFILKSAKTNSKGLTPIYLRITVDGKRFELATNKLIENCKWSSSLKKIKGNSEEARSINEYLKIFDNKVFEAQKQLLIENKEITTDTLRNKLLGKTESQKTIVEVMQVHNENMTNLLGIEYSYNTLKNFKTTLTHLISYLETNYKIKDYPIDKIDLEFMNGFDFYLRANRRCNNNTTIKYVKSVGKILKTCLDNGWITKDPLTNYKAKLKEVQRNYLTEQEIQAILQKTFPSPRLELVRDIFLFSCFTGLAYIDVQQLTTNNITNGIDGDKWIFKNRQKTETPSRIPLLPIAESIIQKYQQDPACLNQDRLLPILSNQKMNAYLKEIADVCGINKELTFHIARHTFATTVTLSNGVPLETVSKMLGHTNIKTTQHYAKILDKKISDDMQILKSKFSNLTIENKKSAQG
ncbi:site-specific integrase [Flavobacterium oreochromis]|uniref:site-specific integrase n=1 Tax=Flavobacterium oreochromis TaxID=2906078 RepID=UPI003860006C